MRGRGVAVLLVLAFAAAIVVGASAQPRARRPHARVITLAINSHFDGTYSNTNNVGDRWCDVTGTESASFHVISLYQKMKLRLVSGEVAGARGLPDITTGEWTESGNQWDTGGGTNDCVGTIHPLQCSGTVGTQGLGYASAQIVRGTVYLSTTTIDLGEVGTDTCGGGPNYVIPYLGLNDALSPWNVVHAHIPLKSLARIRKHGHVVLHAERSPADENYDPGTCNHYPTAEGSSCSGTLDVTGAAITVRVD